MSHPMTSLPNDFVTKKVSEFWIAEEGQAWQESFID
jgi:hypothetical protein